MLRFGRMHLSIFHRLPSLLLAAGVVYVLPTLANNESSNRYTRHTRIKQRTPKETDSNIETAMGQTHNPMNKSAMGTAAEAPSEHKPRNMSPRDLCILNLNRYPDKVQHTVIELQHSLWKHKVRLNEEHQVLVRMDESHTLGSVIDFNGQELTVQWFDETTERFVRQSDGVYVWDKLIVNNIHAKTNQKARQAGKRMLSKSAISSAKYGWFDHLVDLIKGNTPPLVYETFTISDGDMNIRIRFSEDEMAVVHEKAPHTCGTVLDYTGVKLHILWENGSVNSYKRTKKATYRRIDDAAIAGQLRQENGKIQREKGEDDWFQIWWRDINDEEKPLSYSNITLKVNGSDYKPRLCMDNRLLVQMHPHDSWAKIVKYDRKKLHIRWHNKDDEFYERQKDGTFIRCAK